MVVISRYTMKPSEASNAPPYVILFFLFLIFQFRVLPVAMSSERKCLNIATGYECENELTPKTNN